MDAFEAKFSTIRRIYDMVRASKTCHACVTSAEPEVSSKFYNIISIANDFVGAPFYTK